LTNGKRRWGKVITLVVVIAVVIILLLNPAVQGILRSIFIDPFQKSYPEYTTFTVEQTLTVDANGGIVLNYTVDIPLPKTIQQQGHPLQQVIEVTADPEPGDVKDRYGYDWAEWTGSGPVEQGTKSITIRYQMKVSTFIWNLGPDEVGNVSDIPSSLKNAYLGDEWRIIVDHPDIQALASDLVGGERNVLKGFQAIYAWVGENIDYPSGASSSLPQTSIQTLESRVGDCDDQAILFCAVARAAGIPAWLQLGILFDQSRGNWGGHGWVQAYLPLRSGGGVNATIDTVNKDFLVWRPNRFADFTDDGNASHLEDYYFSFYCTYDPASYPPGQTPEFGQTFETIEYSESGNRVRPGDFPAYAATPILSATVQTVRYIPRLGS